MKKSITRQNHIFLDLRKQKYMQHRFLDILKTNGNIFWLTDDDCLQIFIDKKLNMNILILLR